MTKSHPYKSSVTLMFFQSPPWPCQSSAPPGGTLSSSSSPSPSSVTIRHQRLRVLLSCGSTNPSARTPSQPHWIPAVLQTTTTIPTTTPTPIAPTARGRFASSPQSKATPLPSAPTTRVGRSPCKTVSWAEFTGIRFKTFKHLLDAIFISHLLWKQFKLLHKGVTTKSN